MRLWLCVSTALLLTSSASAFADTVYTLENQAGTADYGTITIDSTDGTLVRQDFLPNIEFYGRNVRFDERPVYQQYNAALNVYQARWVVGVYFVLQLSLPVTTLVDYVPANDSSCSILSSTCDYQIEAYEGLISMSNPPVSSVEGNLLATTGNSVTPEPSSLALFGTGVLGVLGVARRKFRKFKS